MTLDAGEQPAKKESNGVPCLILLVVALALLAAYITAQVKLAGVAADPNVSEVIWGRYVYLLNGGEAVVFVAVGWLFGREVNRKQAEQAKAATEQAKKAAAEAAEQEARRRDLAALVRTTLANRRSVAPLDPDLQALIDVAS